jgi:hypothetical protein
MRIARTEIAATISSTKGSVDIVKSIMGLLEGEPLRRKTYSRLIS